MRKVIIVGEKSYIGESFCSWLEQYPEKYSIQLVSSLNEEWKKANFIDVDCVVNFAGIAHINNIKDEMKDLFYSVNKDLAIEVGRWSKEHGVKHFVQFSSMNVYGDFAAYITDLSAENPTSFYGDSKLQGDKGLDALMDDSFAVAHIRPPFVYGKGCKGNYNIIRKIALKTPVFPTYRNKKSMIYIDNLCEFVRLVIENKSVGIFAPQNRELVSTCDLVKEICRVNGKSICLTSLFNWAVAIGKKYNSLFRKAFADDCYDFELSNVFDYKYNIVSFIESVERTEKND